MKVTHYTRILSDLCYRYNKFSKENLLRDSFLSFTFVCFTVWMFQDIKNAENMDVDQLDNVADEEAENQLQED